MAQLTPPEFSSPLKGEENSAERPASKNPD